MTGRASKPNHGSFKKYGVKRFEFTQEVKFCSFLNKMFEKKHFLVAPAEEVKQILKDQEKWAGINAYSSVVLSLSNADWPKASQRDIDAARNLLDYLVEKISREMENELNIRKEKKAVKEIKYSIALFLQKFQKISRSIDLSRMATDSMQNLIEMLVQILKDEIDNPAVIPLETSNKTNIRRTSAAAISQLIDGLGGLAREKILLRISPNMQKNIVWLVEKLKDQKIEFFSISEFFSGLGLLAINDLFTHYSVTIEGIIHNLLQVAVAENFSPRNRGSMILGLGDLVKSRLIRLIDEAKQSQIEKLIQFDLQGDLLAIRQVFDGLERCVDESTRQSIFKKFSSHTVNALEGMISLASKQKVEIKSIISIFLGLESMTSAGLITYLSKNSQKDLWGLIPVFIGSNKISGKEFSQVISSVLSLLSRGILDQHSEYERKILQELIDLPYKLGQKEKLGMSGRNLISLYVKLSELSENQKILTRFKNFGIDINLVIKRYVSDYSMFIPRDLDEKSVTITLIYLIKYADLTIFNHFGATLFAELLTHLLVLEKSEYELNKSVNDYRGNNCSELKELVFRLKKQEFRFGEFFSRLESFKRRNESSSDEIDYLLDRIIFININDTSYALIFGALRKFLEFESELQLSNITKFIIKKLVYKIPVESMNFHNAVNTFYNFGEITRHDFFSVLFMKKIDKIYKFCQSILERISSYYHEATDYAKPGKLEESNYAKNDLNDEYFEDINIFIRGVIYFIKSHIDNEFAGKIAPLFNKIFLPFLSKIPRASNKYNLIFNIGKLTYLQAIEISRKDNLEFVSLMLKGCNVEKESPEKLARLFRGIGYLVYDDAMELSAENYDKLRSVFNKIDMNSNSLKEINFLLSGIVSFSKSKSLGELFDEMISRVETYIYRAHKDIVATIDSFKAILPRKYFMTIGFFFKMLGVLAEVNRLLFLSKESQSKLNEIFHCFLKVNYNIGAINEVLRGVANLAHAGLFVPEEKIKTEAVRAIFNRIVSSGASTSALGNFLLNISKLSKCGIIEKFYLENNVELSKLIKEINKSQPETITLFLYAICKLFESGVLLSLSNEDKANIRKLFSPMSKSMASSIFTAIQSKSFKEDGLEKEGNFSRYFACVAQLQEFKVIHKYDNNDQDLIEKVLIKFIDSKIDGQEFAEVIASLGELISQDQSVRFSRKVIDRLIDHLNQIVSVAVDSKTLDRVLQGIECLVNQGQLRAFSRSQHDAFESLLENSIVVPLPAVTIAHVLVATYKFKQKNILYPLSTRGLNSLRMLIFKLAHVSVDPHAAQEFISSVLLSLEMVFSLLNNEEKVKFFDQEFFKTLAVITRSQSQFALSCPFAGRWIKLILNIDAYSHVANNKFNPFLQETFARFVQFYPESELFFEILTYIKKLDANDLLWLLGKGKTRSRFLLLLNFFSLKETANSDSRKIINYFVNFLSAHEEILTQLPDTEMLEASDSNLIETQYANQKVAQVFTPRRRNKNNCVFDVNNPDDLKRLCMEANIKYRPNKIKEDEVVIAKIWALNDYYGVLAKQDYLTVDDNGIPKRHAFGSFIGHREILNGEAELDYAFEVPPNFRDERRLTIINAKETRNFTAFINDSFTPNCTTAILFRNNTQNVYFFLEANVLREQQFFISYGGNYFSNVSNSVTQIFMHKTDNWRGPDDIYSEHIDNYFPTVVALSKEFATAIGFAHAKLFLVTHLFKAVLENNLKNVQARIEKGDQVDLPSYALEVDEDNFSMLKTSNCKKQQNITPIMLACYLGKEKLVKCLIEKGADINRRALQTGYSAIFFAVIGNASEKLKIEVIQHLINAGTYINFIDYQHLNLLQHMIRKNEVALARMILEDRDTARELITPMLEDDKQDIFLTCLLAGNIEMVELIITNTDYAYLINKLKNHTLPLSKAIIEVDVMSLNSLLSIFYSIKHFLQDTQLIKMVFNTLLDRLQIATNKNLKLEVDIIRNSVNSFLSMAKDYNKSDHAILSLISTLRNHYEHPEQTKQETYGNINRKRKNEDKENSGDSSDEENRSRKRTSAYTSVLRFFKHASSQTGLNPEFEEALVAIKRLLDWYSISPLQSEVTKSTLTTYEIQMEIATEQQRTQLKSILDVPHGACVVKDKNLIISNVDLAGINQKIKELEAHSENKSVLEYS